MMEAESSIEKRTRHITSNTRRPPLETRPYLPGHTIPGFFFLSSQQRNNEKNENIRGTKTHRGKHSDMSIPFFFFSLSCPSFFIISFFHHLRPNLRAVHLMDNGQNVRYIYIVLTAIIAFPFHEIVVFSKHPS